MACHGIARVWVGVVLIVLAGCSPIQLGSRTIDFGGGGPRPPGTLTPANGSTTATMQPLQPTGGQQVFGHGPVQVALLLPLSGDPSLASVGQSMANGSRLAMSFIEANPNIAENTTITLYDTGGTVAGATSAVTTAAQRGARLILGPLKGDEVTAAGAVARSNGLPLIGFSNNASAAGPGVYLLSVLPETEMKRAMAYLKAQGRRGVAGAFPNTAYGQAQQTAFRQQAIAAGFSPSAVYSFSDASEAKGIVDQAKPLIAKGLIDSFFLPDRLTAPSFANLLAQAGVKPDDVMIVGSADWQGDANITGTPALAGAIYPGVDDTGLKSISLDYQARFGAPPHPLTTIAYTATILANAKTLSLANPPYNPTIMTSPTGFNGRDGVFRFNSDGRADYALAIKRVAPGGSVQVEAAAL